MRRRYPRKGAIMKPTNQLRFVERETHHYENPEGTVATVSTIRVLQQWWEKVSYHDVITSFPIGEWRDVPLEAEGK